MFREKRPHGLPLFTACTGSCLSEPGVVGHPRNIPSERDVRRGGGQFLYADDRWVSGVSFHLCTDGTDTSRLYYPPPAGGAFRGDNVGFCRITYQFVRFRGMVHTVIFRLCLVGYVGQLVWYVRKFRQIYGEGIRRLSDFYAEDEDRRLHWINRCFYMALTIGILALVGAFMRSFYYHFLYLYIRCFMSTLQ